MWLQNHAVDPWSEATVRQLNKLIRNLKNSQEVEQQNGDVEVSELDQNDKKETLCQETKPDDVSIFKLRRVQLEKYLKEKPNAKGKEVLKQIQNQKTVF